MNKRGLLLLLVLLISSFAIGFATYDDVETCHDAGGLWCDNFESNQCAEKEDLTDSSHAIDCQISGEYSIDVSAGLANVDILYFNKLIFNSGASIHFVNGAASESTMFENGYEYPCSGASCMGEGGAGGSRDSDGGDGGAGGDGAIAGSKGETGEAGDQPGDSPGDEECNSGNPNGGKGGNAGADITIIATEIEVSGTVIISVSGESGTTGNNCLNTGGNNAGSGGGGGGGGGGAGILYVLVTELSGSGELKLTAEGGLGGNGKAGKDDDGIFGGNDDGGGGGGGAGGEGGKAHFFVENTTVSYSLSASGGSGGSGGSGPDDADDGVSGEEGPDGNISYPYDWDISTIGIKETDFGNPYFVCNDAIDNDVDGDKDMADEDCFQAAATLLGWKTNAWDSTADWFDASSNTGADGVCGDDAFVLLNVGEDFFQTFTGSNGDLDFSSLTTCNDNGGIWCGSASSGNCIVDTDDDCEIQDSQVVKLSGKKTFLFTKDLTILSGKTLRFEETTPGNIVRDNGGDGKCPDNECTSGTGPNGMSNRGGSGGGGGNGYGNKGASGENGDLACCSNSDCNSQGGCWGGSGGYAGGTVDIIVKDSLAILGNILVDGGTGGGGDSGTRCSCGIFGDEAAAAGGGGAGGSGGRLNIIAKNLDLSGEIHAKGGMGGNGGMGRIDDDGSCGDGEHGGAGGGGGGGNGGQVNIIAETYEQDTNTITGRITISKGENGIGGPEDDTPATVFNDAPCDTGPGSNGEDGLEGSEDLEDADVIIACDSALANNYCISQGYGNYLNGSMICNNADLISSLACESNEDYGYITPNGTFFCNKDSSDFIWENAHLSPLGTILDLSINNEERVEHIATNSQRWFVCDANSATALTQFSGTNYTSTVNEYASFTNPQPSLNLGEMSCLDAVNQVFTNPPFSNCYDTFGEEFENTTDYTNCCEPWTGIGQGHFQLGIEGSFESNCGQSCYGSNGDSLGVGLCSNSNFVNTQFCLGSQFSNKSDYILKGVCGFDMQTCLSESLDPHASCESQGFTHSTICTDNNPICTGDLIYSGDSGSPELKCCVSNSEEVSCLDTIGSNVGEEFCEENGGTVYNTNEASCEPGNFSFGMDNQYEKCCFGFITPSVILWNQPPAEKFICYKESDSNNYAECCFDDSCVNAVNNPRNIRGSGGRLHQLTRFDKYNSQTGLFQDFIWQWSSAQDGQIAVSTPPYYIINDWTSFNTLEFDIAFNLPNIFEIILVHETGEKYNLGKLSKYLVTGNETFRWQRAIVILPKEDIAGKVINYSNIKVISFNVTFDNGFNSAQYVLDDPVLSRMEVLT